MRFYLGVHRPNWLGRTDVPLFVSHRVLRDRKSFHRATGPWALDSGGFTEVNMHGEWRTTVAEYVEAVERYQGGVGGMEWAAPQDWMCEPIVIDKTGLSVREHQERTVANYLDLRGQGPFIPVLQGWERDEYLRCIDLYGEAGVDLAAEPVVGVGSVCRRQDTAFATELFTELAAGGLRCHGFGVKVTGLRKYGHLLASADSMAWSYRARRSEPLPGCEHRNCANCLRFALRWRETLAMGQAHT